MQLVLNGPQSAFAALRLDDLDAARVLDKPAYSYRVLVGPTRDGQYEHDRVRFVVPPHRSELVDRQTSRVPLHGGTVGCHLLLLQRPTNGIAL